MTVIMFMYVYSCNALSARFFVVDRALNSYFMIMITIKLTMHKFHTKQDTIKITST